MNSPCTGKEMKFRVGHTPVPATDRVKITAIQKALGKSLEWEQQRRTLGFTF